MVKRLFLFLCLGMLGLAGPYSAAQDPAVPDSFAAAREVFLKAWNFEQSKDYAQALSHYRACLAFFRNAEQKDHALVTLNNIGEIFIETGDYSGAVEIFREGVTMAGQVQDLRRGAEFHHKLGVLFSHMSGETKKIQAAEAESKKEVATGTYTRLTQMGDQFYADYIHMGSSENPFESPDRTYSRLLNLKVSSDFMPDKLIVPDTVAIDLRITKRGYFPVMKRQTLLAAIDYNLFDETMMGIPRQVRPIITEDFYRSGIVIPDEITLAALSAKQTGRPVAISEQESFRPGNYRLSVVKAGYVPISRDIVVEPGEGVRELPVYLESKLRLVKYAIQTNFLASDQPVAPDTITLDGQTVAPGKMFKPKQEYSLLIKEDGYETIAKTIMIPPAEGPFEFTEFMRTLPREVIFRMTGDYGAEEISPDEVSLNRQIKYGEKVMPDVYRLTIRKNGYDVVTDTVVIEPKSEPYVLKRHLLSTPRTVELNILASFPKGQRILPQTGTLDEVPIQPDKAFKPREYNLVLRHPGYYPITKKVTIAPDSVPFRIDETVYAKPREVVVEVGYDVEPEDTRLKAKLSFENERTKELLRLEGNDVVPTESYILRVEREGYEMDTSKHLVAPSEEAYKIQRKLLSSMRPVVPRIIAEYPPKQVIAPSEITIDTRPVGKDFKAKPGVHELVVMCDGYIPIRESIEILASSKDYRLNRTMLTRERQVNFNFKDSFNGISLIPDEVTLRGETIDVSQAKSLKPGIYDLSVRLSGYLSLNKQVEIPVGVTPHLIEDLLTASKREITPYITSDYTGKLLRLDEIDTVTLNDIPIEGMKDPNTGKIYVRPGAYTMMIQKRGYLSISKKIEVDPAPTAYDIRETLVSKQRQVNITVKSSFPFAPAEGIAVDSLKVGDGKFKTGESIKPGTYVLAIDKKGYRSISEQIVVEPSETPYTVVRTMETLPRAVVYEIVSDYDRQLMPAPDVLTINDQNVDQKAPLIPGRYTVRVEHLGYHPKKTEILVEPSDEPYLLQIPMISMHRQIETLIFADFPPGSYLDTVGVISLSGKDVRKEGFKPGNYDLRIEQPGFEAISEKVSIPPHDEPYLIERTLKSIPRRVEEDITYNVAPPENLPPYRITMAPPNDPAKAKEAKTGDKIATGEYMLRITKEAYQTLEVRKDVWPSPQPFVIREQLVAKNVTLLIDITYNVVPPASLAPYSVQLIDSTGIPRAVEHGHLVRPGEYNLKVQRPGYTFGAKKIFIVPSEQPFFIKEHLTAKPRQLSFDMVGENGVMVPAYKVVNEETKKDVKFEDRFEAGKEVNLTILFKEYKTVNSKFTVEPGEGPFRANVPMTRLYPNEFTVRFPGSNPPTEDLDGISYPYVYLVDGNPVESHLLQAEPGQGRWHYTLWAEKSAKNLDVYGGYLYAQVGLGRPLPRFSQVSMPKLIDHLRQIVSMPARGHRGALEVLEEGLKVSRWKRMIEDQQTPQIESLIRYLESWFGQIDNPLEQRLRGVIDILDKMRRN